MWPSRKRSPEAPPLRRRWRVLGGLLLALLLGSAAVAVWATRVLIPELERDLVGLDTWRPPTVVRVYDATGSQVDEFFLVRREWADIDALPEALLDAVVAAEDRRYFEHLGVDPWGILRAFASNLGAGEIKEGGSTITQQVVKNVVVGKDRTLERKLREAMLALLLETRMSKRDILELYLNLIYLGSGNYGVEAAARDYVGVSARELDPAGAALLAGLIPSPSRYSPRQDLELAASRRDLVLHAMHEMGAIETSTLTAGLDTAIVLPERGGPSQSGGEAYLTRVRREIRDLLGTELPFEAGLSVHTHLDPPIQRLAEAAVDAAAEAIEERQGRRLQRTELEPAQTSTTPGSCGPMRALGGDRVEVGTRTLSMAGGTWSAKVWQPQAQPKPLGLALRRGDGFIGCVTEEGDVRPRWNSRVQGAAVVLEHATGKVRAIVGGRQMALEGFNRATQARRQAGSAFKPFVYLTALDLGQSQLDVTLDAPLSLDAGGQRQWVPKNASGGYWGPVALRWAFAFSLNTVAVRLVMENGSAAVIERARAAGIESPLRTDLTMALGTSELRPLELATGIAGIVRGGVAVEPVFIERLVDVSGTRVASAGEAIQIPGVNVRLPGGDGPRFAKPGASWELRDMMKAVVEKGTGRAAAREGYLRGGKTGTSSDYKDAWFVGYQGDYVIAVWMGQDDGQPLGLWESGDKAALPAWTTIADALPPGSAPEPPLDVIPIPFAGGFVDVSAENVPRHRLGWTPVAADAPLPEAPAEPSCDP